MKASHGLASKAVLQYYLNGKSEDVIYLRVTIVAC
jgi:hypothetical protein